MITGVNRTLLVVATIALVALAGCSGLPGGDQSGVDDGVSVEDDSTGATNVTQSVGIEVTESTAGEELTHVGATYPRDDFSVGSAQHDAIEVTVDADGDGETERTFTGANVSGVNNNDYSFDVTLETGYPLESGDVVTVEYPTVSNPSEPGNYTVEVRLNEEQSTNATVAID